MGTLVNLLIFENLNVCGQNVGISANGLIPNVSALLDVDAAGSTPKKGLLIPRISLTSATDVTTIPTPATSLMVYNTGSGALSPAGYYYNQGTTGAANWIPFLTNYASSPAAWSLGGNTGTTASAAAIGSAVTDNFIGTTDTKDFVFASNNKERMRISTGGNVGIGTKTPASMLDVTGDIIATAGGTIGVTVVQGVYGTPANISNTSPTYTGEYIVLPPGSWVVHFNSFYDWVESTFGVDSYCMTALGTCQNCGGLGNGGLSTGNLNFIPFYGVWFVSHAVTTTYYINHYVVLSTPAHAKLRASFGSWYAVKQN